MNSFGPGKDLYDYMHQLYGHHSGKGSFIREMDDDLRADGKLQELLLHSSLYYLVRRLIMTAEYFLRKFPTVPYGDVKYKRELKSHLKDFTGYDSHQVDEIVMLLGKCIDTAKQEISDGSRNQKRREAKDENRNCYICGRDINYDIENDDSSYSLDHVWPNALGGACELENLSVACRRCNSKIKKDFIGAADFHYEQFSLKSTSLQEYLTRDTLTRSHPSKYDIAVFAKNNFSCAVCGQPAYRVGKLHVGRIEPSESWHFLNLQSYCENHLPDTD